ncbi:ribulose phosphate epimerase [Nannocystis pusilla]|uniref:Ribulose phosphate epimerase n=1 Tax=Nannocystis pusilla TaxID=889268 RepID=A0A9X3EU20_9BACT|nr:ribulose phosphate epimerase [Nannocystis pusilla]MCY1005493.1 ribulose phosphate epimerase [Nannocystis pusilla]
MVPDDGTSKACDVWAQDCPEGQKCMPYSGDGDNAWESLKCVDVVPNPDGFGEPCKAIGGPVSGEDTCDKGLMCWDVDVDTGEGVCVFQCTGNPESPSCPDPTFTCNFAADGVLTLCFPPCDPLAQDCPGGDLCIPNPMVLGSFLCVLDASGDEGQAFDGCEFANVCDPGLSCLDPGLAVECDPMSTGCCVPFCDISAPNTCPGQGQECISWYEDIPAPPGLENVGICSLPDA